MGIIITISLVNGRHASDYFTTTSDMHGNEWIESKMERKRFELIWRNLHFDVDLVIESLKTRFQYNWSPSQHVTFDETIIPFLGKFFAKVRTNFNYITFPDAC